MLLCVPLCRLCLSLLTSSSIQKTARRAVASAQNQRISTQGAARKRDTERQAAALKREADRVANRLEELSLSRAKNDKDHGTLWIDEQKKRRARTEFVIHAEEEKLRAQERSAQVEAERIRKETEARAAAEEQRKKDEAAKAEKAAKEAEEAKANAEKEAAARKEVELVEQAKAQALQAQSKERKALGMTTPDQDWREARLVLKVRFLPAFDRDHLLTKRHRN
jgi:nucleoporin GLE1